MKKSFSLFKGVAFNKSGFLPFLMTFLFFAAMQVDMKAQNSSTLPSQSQSQNEPAVRTMYKLPAGPFVSVELAKERLYDAMKALRAQMAQAGQGTASYDAAYLRMTYFGHIKSYLESGKGVAQSIVDGLALISNDLHFGVSPEQAVAEKNAAINLLKA
jgi:hypothetical protein